MHIAKKNRWLGKSLIVKDMIKNRDKNYKNDIIYKKNNKIII